MKNKLFFLIPIFFVSAISYASVNRSNYFLCVKENGTFDAVVNGFTKKQDCKNKELKIQLQKQDSSFYVFDSNNVNLGRFISFDYIGGGSYMYLVYNEDLNLFIRYSYQIGEITGQNIYSDGQNCTGNVFMDKVVVAPGFVYYFNDNFYTYDKENTDDILILSVASNSDAPQCGDYSLHNRSAKGMILLRKIDNLNLPAYPLYIKNR